MKSILDRSFQYTPSVATDVRKTFARVREQQRAAQSTTKVVLPMRTPAAKKTAAQS
jgi:hypothetical protein